ncbi:helix-turn-helix domain-containing protein [Hyphococcus sp.]|uniref:helix-turn-helix domain-containing protein n=1 Tax=Hyphococcus sp. TaxID=2038636 RepID=UPI0037539DF3
MRASDWCYDTILYPCTNYGLWRQHCRQITVTAMLTKEQCRAARAFLDWGIRDLADTAGISATTVNTFEQGYTAPTRATLAAIRRAFEEAGIIFTNGEAPGVAMGKPKDAAD